jgi:hypothetical protein
VSAAEIIRFPRQRPKPVDPRGEVYLCECPYRAGDWLVIHESKWSDSSVAWRFHDHGRAVSFGLHLAQAYGAEFVE